MKNDILKVDNEANKVVSSYPAFLAPTLFAVRTARLPNSPNAARCGIPVAAAVALWATTLAAAVAF